MPDAIHVDIVRVPGRRLELRHNGRVLRTVRDNGYGPYYARVEEEKLRVALAKQRPCLTCGESFPSQGPHNRLCARCRRSS